MPKGKGIVDLTGQKISKLLVLGYSHRDDRGVHFFDCQCDCGNIVKVQYRYLMNNRKFQKSCGCAKVEYNEHRPDTFIDLTGKVFGRLTVIGFNRKELVPTKNGHTEASWRYYWDCRCICGVELVVLGNSLTTGHTKSCGCQVIDSARELMTKHGLSRVTRAYKSWHSMIRRCTNLEDTNYVNYGGRGITVCGRWLESFENFYEDMGEPLSERHSIDRIDNNGPYSPENCRWATAKEQGNNRRNTVYITFNNITRCLSDWSDIVGLSSTLLRSRIKGGWEAEELLFTPKGMKRGSGYTLTGDGDVDLYERAIWNMN